MGFSSVGSDSQDCPLKKTALVVFVRNAATLEPVPGANVNLIKASPQPGTKPTESQTALAKFPKAKPGTYTVQVALPPSLKADDFEDVPESSVAVTLGECAYHVVDILPRASLKVKVVCKDTDNQGAPTETILDGVSVKIDGLETRQGTTTGAPDGWASFPKLKSGQYVASIVSLGSHASAYSVQGAGQTIAVPAGGQRELVLEVVPSGWVEFLVVEDGTDPQVKVKGVVLKAKLPGDKTNVGTTTDQGLARMEKLKQGTADLLEMSSDDAVWEVISFS